MNALVLHYHALRRLVGLLSVSIPVVLPAGLFVLGDPHPIRESISAYHGTGMRDVFVSLVSSVGVFLFAYRGYTGHRVGRFEIDQIAGSAASGFAAIVALCPVDGGSAMNTLHLVGGTGMFLSLAYFSLFLFTRSSGTTPRKRQRNHVYRACGLMIVGCIVLMGIDWLWLQGTWLDAWHPTFLLEALMLYAFGISWAVKGEMFLADR
jgi:F0F1-type ATP synthase assembly protein I